MPAPEPPSLPSPPASWLDFGWRHKGWFAAAKGLGLVAALLLLWLAPRQYEATAWLEVPPTEEGVREEGLRTHEARIAFPSILAKALGGEPDGRTVADFQRSVRVHLLRRTRLLGVSVRDAAPAAARERANALASAYLADLEARRRETLTNERNLWAEQRDRSRSSWEAAEKALQLERFPAAQSASGAPLGPGASPPASAAAGSAMREATLLAASRSASVSHDAALRQLHEAVSRLHSPPPAWRLEPAVLPLKPVWPAVWPVLIGGIITGGVLGVLLLWLKNPASFPR